LAIDKNSKCHQNGIKVLEDVVTGHWNMRYKALKAIEIISRYFDRNQSTGNHQNLTNELMKNCGLSIERLKA
jgi:1,4-alpha-glucan branching enzyme